MIIYSQALKYGFKQELKVDTDLITTMAVKRCGVKTIKRSDVNIY
jgi:hypothetical protein